MTPQDIVIKLKANRDKIRNRIAFSTYSEDNLFHNLSKDLNIAKNTIGADDNDFYRYIVARLGGKV